MRVTKRKKYQHTVTLDITDYNRRHKIVDELRNAGWIITDEGKGRYYDEIWVKLFAKTGSIMPPSIPENGVKIKNDSLSVR